MPEYRKGVNVVANLNEQIGKINEQIKQLQNKKKALLAKESEEKRKKRTKRLIERGAILESVIGNAENFSNEQLQALLCNLYIHCLPIRLSNAGQNANICISRSNRFQ